MKREAFLYEKEKPFYLKICPQKFSAYKSDIKRLFLTFVISVYLTNLRQEGDFVVMIHVPEAHDFSHVHTHSRYQ